MSDRGTAFRSVTAVKPLWHRHFVQGIRPLSPLISPTAAPVRRLTGIREWLRQIPSSSRLPRTVLVSMFLADIIEDAGLVVGGTARICGEQRSAAAARLPILGWWT